MSILSETCSGTPIQFRRDRAVTAQRGALIFYRAGADRIFTAALSPREFRRTTPLRQAVASNFVPRPRTGGRFWVNTLIQPRPHLQNRDLA